MSQVKLWIVDDDELFARSCVEYFRNEAFSVSHFPTGRALLERLTRGDLPDLLLLDYRLPDVLGTRLCRKVLSSAPKAKIVFITAYGSYDMALEAMDIGAFAYVVKPVDLDALKSVLERAAATLARDARGSASAPAGMRQPWELIGESPAMLHVRATIELAAASDSPILITGETGTGKTLVARLVHIRSGRPGQFVQVNCASLPESLVESELFGYAKGAFTGATTEKKGLLEMAHRGTILLDEVTEMPPHVQAKLLTAIDDGEIRRVGDTIPRSLDVRILAATNVSLDHLLREKKFRDDLYYRLAVIRIHLPPLRDRREDIPLLVEHLLNTLSPEFPRKLAPGEMDLLATYSWPGNVRELKNVLQRTLVLTPQGLLRPSEHLETKQAASAPEGTQDELEFRPLDDFLRSYAQRVFVATGRNYSKTARILRISTGRLRRILAGSHKNRQQASNCNDHTA